MIETAHTELLTVEQVAAWFHVSPGWIRDHASGRKRPVLPCRKLGKCLRFDSQDCETFLQEAKSQQAAVA
jgi:hypothetical protein